MENENCESQTNDKTRRVQERNSTSFTSHEKNNPPLKPYQPPFPFPGRAIQDKQNEEYKKFLEHIKALQINVPFIEEIT